VHARRRLAAATDVAEFVDVDRGPGLRVENWLAAT
jgi:hypothetical protein